MKTLGRLDGFLGGHMAPVVLCCVALGIAFPEVLSHLNGVTVGLFAFMTFSNSLGGGFRELAQVVRHPLPVAVIFGLLHVVMPLITLGLGTLCFPDAPLFTIGLVLEYAVPTGVASLMWVGMSRGNTALCLSVVLLDTLLSPVVIPLTMKLLVGSVVELDTWGMMRDLLLMVALPALAAMVLYQLTKGAVAVTLKPKLSLPAKAALLLIITANATGCAPFLRNLTPTLVRVMIVVFFLCLLFPGVLGGAAVEAGLPHSADCRPQRRDAEHQRWGGAGRGLFPRRRAVSGGLFSGVPPGHHGPDREGPAGHQARPGGSGGLRSAPGGGTVPVMEYAVFAWRPPIGRPLFLRSGGRLDRFPLPFWDRTCKIKEMKRRWSHGQAGTEGAVAPGGGNPPQSHAAPADL